MSKINYCRFVVIVGLCFSLFGLVSCGWPVTETKTYHAPNWTPDGRIVAEVQVVKLQRTLVSNSEYVGGYTGIVIMDKDGSNEELLFETSGGGASRIEMSPLGNYVGVIFGVGLYLYDSNGNLLKKILPDPVISDIKFSPDESKLYGTEYSDSMTIFLIPELGILNQNSSGGGGVWKNQDSIYFYQKRPVFKLSEWKINLDEIETLEISYGIDVYIPSEEIGFLLSGTELYIVNIRNTEVTTVPFSYSPYDYQDFTNQQLSRDGREIVMGAKSILNFHGTGIYILDIENGGITYIK